MSPTFALSGGAIDDAEATAAIAAVLCVLEEEAATAEASPPAPPARWRNAAKLTIQGLTPSRLPAAPTWGHIERLRRAGRGGSGIVGQ